MVQTSPAAATLLWLIFVPLVGLPLAMVLALAYRPASEETIDAFAERYRAPRTRASRALIAAYLRRSTRYRATGACLGCYTTALLVIDTGRVGFGLGPQAPTSDLFLMGLGGFLVGVLTAELYNVRRRFDGPRLASISVRSLDDYRSSRHAWRAGLFAALAPVIALVDAVGRRGLDPTLAVLAIASIAALLLVEAVQRRVVLRPQPVMSDDLVAADVAIRIAAIRTLSYAVTAFGILLAAWSLNAVAQDQWPQHATAAGILSFVATGCYTVAFVLATAARRATRPRLRKPGTPAPVVA